MELIVSDKVVVIVILIEHLLNFLKFQTEEKEFFPLYSYPHNIRNRINVINTEFRGPVRRYLVFSIEHDSPKDPVAPGSVL